MGYARTSWSLVAVTLVTATAGLLVLSPPSQAGAERAPQVAGSLRLPDATVAPGADVTLSGTLPPRRSRPVELQTMRDGSWRVLATRATSARGSFRFTTTSPTTAGARKYRVLAPAVRLDGRRYDAVVTPVRTLTVVRTVGVTAGWRHSCALGSNGRAWCWGSNASGELGIGDAWADQDLIHRPTPVVGRGWTDLSAAGASTCGLNADGAWCWGDVASYLVTDGSYRAPVQITGEWSQISAGAFYFCGVDEQGAGWCQGRNDDGQLGNPAGGQASPTQLPGTWREVVPGVGWETSATTCGIQTDLSAWCWGAGTQGQLGNDANDSSPVPVEVAGDHQWASLSVGGSHVCGIDTTGAGWCWGANTDGRLGGQTFAASRVPARVTAAATWASIDAGFQHTCGVTTTGEGWCWGWNSQGQLGNGTNETTYFPEPVPTRLPGTWTSLAAGQDASAGSRRNGTAWAWGEGAFGQLGAGAADPSYAPVSISP